MRQDDYLSFSPLDAYCFPFSSLTLIALFFGFAIDFAIPVTSGLRGMQMHFKACSKRLLRMPSYGVLTTNKGVKRTMINLVQFVMLLHAGIGWQGYVSYLLHAGTMPSLPF
jgi:hypothetical protein